MELIKIKSLLTIILGLMVNNVYAQCTEQKDFDVSWKVNNYNISYEIKRKDGKEFTYYYYPRNSTQVYEGVKLNESIENAHIDEAMFAIFGNENDTNKEKEYYIKLSNILTENNKFSLYTNSMRISNMYHYPFQESEMITRKIVKKSLNLDNEMFTFLSNNEIYWRHKLRYYIILLHDRHGEKCSYFESPEITYNFGIKPISLIWRDLWNQLNEKANIKVNIILINNDNKSNI